jgi:hypothetical protein
VNGRDNGAHARLPFKTASKSARARPRGAGAPELCERSALFIQRAQGRLGAGRTHGPRANENARGRNHRYEPNNQPSLRNGLRLTPSSPRGPGFFAPVTCTTRKRRRRLGISVGMPGPHGLAVRVRVVRLRANSAPQPRCVHRIPRSTFVTIAKRPSCSSAGHEQGTPISGKTKAVFFVAGLDRWNRVERA